MPRISSLTEITAPAGTESVPLSVTGGNARISTSNLVKNTAFIASGGSAARTSADRAGDVANVLDFGAAGNGTGDDLGAIEAAIASLPSGGEVFIPAGTYRISARLSVDASNIHIVGAGAGATTILADYGNDFILVVGTTTDTGHTNCSFRGFTLAYDVTNTTGAAVATLCTSEVVFEALETFGCRTSFEIGQTGVADSTLRLTVKDSLLVAVSHHGLVFNNGSIIAVSNCKVNGTGTAGKAAVCKPSTGNNVDGLVLSDCTFENFPYGVLAPGGISNLRMTGNLFDRNTTAGIDASTASGCTNSQWSIDASNTFSGSEGTPTTAKGVVLDMTTGAIADMSLSPYLRDFGHEAVSTTGAVDNINLTGLRVKDCAYVSGKSVIRLNGSPTNIHMSGAVLDCPSATYGVYPDVITSITLGVNAILATTPLNNATGVVVGAGGLLDQYVAGTLAYRVDASQRLLLGTGGAALSGVSGEIGRQQVVAPVNAEAVQAFLYANLGTGPIFDGMKSRGATVGAHAAVQSGDYLNHFRGAGSDGTNFVAAAEAIVQCAAAPSSGVVPGRYVIRTANLSGTMAEVGRFEYEATCTFGGPQGTEAFRVVPVSSQVNRVNAQGAASGAAPRLAVAGGDANADLLLLARGTGLLSFGTHSAIGAETITGYITIKDASGNTRKLAVVS